MPTTPHAALTRRERQIMDILYRRGRATAAEVMERDARRPALLHRPHAAPRPRGKGARSARRAGAALRLYPRRAPARGAQVGAQAPGGHLLRRVARAGGGRPARRRHLAPVRRRPGARSRSSWRRPGRKAGDDQGHHPPLPRAGGRLLPAEAIGRVAPPDPRGGDRLRRARAARRADGASLARGRLPGAGLRARAAPRADRYHCPGRSVSGSGDGREEHASFAAGSRPPNHLGPRHRSQPAAAGGQPGSTEADRPSSPSGRRCPLVRRRGRSRPTLRAPPSADHPADDAPNAAVHLGDPAADRAAAHRGRNVVGGAHPRRPRPRAGPHPPRRLGDARFSPSACGRSTGSTPSRGSPATACASRASTRATTPCCASGWRRRFTRRSCSTLRGCFGEAAAPCSPRQPWRALPISRGESASC